MTTTLATLAGIPGLRTPEGDPIHLVSSRAEKAELAACPCGALICEGPLRPFSEALRLHRSFCGESRGKRRVSYWRFA